MAQNYRCRPLLKQLFGHNQSLLWEMIRPFVYRSHEPIFIILVHGGLIWIPHELSIVDEENHHFKNILKTFDHVFFFQVDDVP